ncbi:cell division protein ZapE [Shewanella salipaludis]|nr:cell division protein ZapE [Shewanella salipaludis]
MTLSPQDLYRAKLTRQFIDDPAQHQAVQALDALYHRLLDTPKAKLKPEPKGLYLWGDVGRGKTMLMDLFFDSLPLQHKLRLHFHRFMARIHRELSEIAGSRDPLKRVAKGIAAECRVLCFDEFFVSDIGDAMILGKLFEALFEQGVILVATSNIPVAKLYHNGLARDRFLPCIELLQRHTLELHLDGEQDHRLHAMTERPAGNCVLHNYFLPHEKDFGQLLTELTPAAISAEAVTLCRRPIPVIAATTDVAWFDFNDLCDGPRSQLDYIELAERFHTLLLSGVPRLGGEIKGWIRARGTEDGTGSNQAATTGERQLAYAQGDDPARRFISLVDELYDQGVNLYISAAVPLTELYQGGALSFEFRRTHSRLIEMGHRLGDNEPGHAAKAPRTGSAEPRV